MKKGFEKVVGCCLGIQISFWGRFLHELLIRIYVEHWKKGLAGDFAISVL
jgi:hypothetical protein